MKEKWQELEALFSEDNDVTAREFCLTVAVAFLFGMVLGMFCSPRKNVTVASNNGSNNSCPCEEENDEDVVHFN